MKRTLSILALIFLTNLATYKLCVGVYEQGYREIERKNDIAVKVINAYESRFELTKLLTDLVMAQYTATNEGNFELADSIDQQLAELQIRFQESNKQIEALQENIEQL